MSDIRVSVQWKSSTVFAGEDIECTITFKNVARIRRTPSPNSQLRGQGLHRERWKESLPSHLLHKPAGGQQQRKSSLASQPGYRKHKPALSLSTPNGNFSPQQQSNEPPPQNSTHQKRRSISIVSIGSNLPEEDSSHVSPLSAVTRPKNGHSRAASLQILPKRNGFPSPRPTSATGDDRAFSSPTPLLRNPAFSGPAANSYAAARSHGQNTSAGASPAVDLRRSVSRASSYRSQQPQTLGEERYSDTAKETPGSRALSPGAPNRGDRYEQINVAAKILSPASINGTPRSSGEFYSLSNNSNETLASEYMGSEVNSSLLRPGHNRQGSNMIPIGKATPEVLMMGYGQITGTYILDGSLINQAPFEEVKRKGIVGGQGGGGVVRSQSTKRDSGILGSLGWSGIGTSIGGLLGAEEVSSIKEKKSSGSSSRSIPLLSTPQAILFVDLRLEPGESKSFTYSHPLPRGLPPSHKGKAMKIAYNLVIGTQRATQVAQNNHVQRVEIPFRVLTSVNSQGETLGHDLMIPQTILSNKALTSPVGDPSPKDLITHSVPDPSSGKTASSATDFSSYVSKLLSESATNQHNGLLSPTIDDSNPHLPLLPLPEPTTKESIDLAILKSNASTSSKQSANRFEIKRAGAKIAVIMLPRPAFRLGETLSACIDFLTADIPCYALHASLETSETIDPTIALRSKASILRVTRRVHASQYSSTVSAGRVLFSPTIPLSAAPEFVTTGVNLEWRLRFEFVTGRLGESEELGGEAGEDLMMEEVAKDERGSVRAAVQGLRCESFDVTVPLRVYGAVGPFDENFQAGELAV